MRDRLGIKVNGGERATVNLKYIIHEILYIDTFAIFTEGKKFATI